MCDVDNGSGESDEIYFEDSDHIDNSMTKFTLEDGTVFEGRKLTTPSELSEELHRNRDEQRKLVWSTMGTPDEQWPALPNKKNDVTRAQSQCSAKFFE